MGLIMGDVCEQTHDYSFKDISSQNPGATGCWAVFTCVKQLEAQTSRRVTLIPTPVVRTWSRRVAMQHMWRVCGFFAECSASLETPNVLEYFPWMGLNGLFVLNRNTCKSVLNSGWCVFSSFPLAPTYRCVSTETKSFFFHSHTWRKLRRWFFGVNRFI